MANRDYKVPDDTTPSRPPIEHIQAKDNVAKLSEILAGKEASVHSDEVPAKLKSAGVKGMIAAVAAAGVMGVSSMLNAEEVKEATPPPVEPAPVEQVVETPVPAFNLEQEDTQVQRELPFVEAHVETAERSWWHDVPIISQQALTYQGRETDYGCAPTAVSMVTAYWHNQNADNETRSAQALLDANVAQGVFTGDGMSVTNLHDELSALGYDVVDFVDADLTTLKREVANGPVIAVVKLGMSTDGTPHSVVVTGISENNDVRVNDPWTGEARTYSWEAFSRSWGSTFKDVSSHNHFTVIRPA